MTSLSKMTVYTGAKKATHEELKSLTLDAAAEAQATIMIKLRKLDAPITYRVFRLAQRVISEITCDEPYFRKLCGQYGIMWIVAAYTLSYRFDLYDQSEATQHAKGAWKAFLETIADYKTCGPATLNALYAAETDMACRMNMLLLQKDELEDKPKENAQIIRVYHSK